MTPMTRLSDQELEAFLNDTESNRVERKESFKGNVPKKVRQAVCAFANDLPGHNQPGILFIAAKDNAEPSEIYVDDQLLLSLANMKTDGNILNGGGVFWQINDLQSLMCNRKYF